MTKAQLRSARGQSSLSAFKADFPTHARATSRADDEAITMAILLHHAALANRPAAARRSLLAAKRIAKETLEPWEIEEGPPFDEPGRPSPHAMLRRVAERTMQHGYLHLAGSILDSLDALTPPETLESGRLLSQRGSLSIVGGHGDLSLMQYRELVRLGRRIREPELIARGIHGQSAVMYKVGNRPAFARLARRVILLAGDRFTSLASAATQALSIDAAMRRDFDAALLLAWRSTQFAKAINVDGSWVNIGQILLDAGYPAQGRAAARHFLDNPRQLTAKASALGVYALASAALGDPKGVEWALTTLLEWQSFPQEAANALLECSFALEHIGQTRRAREIRTRALEIARRYGFHDIAYLAEHSVRRGVVSQPLATKKASRAIATEVAELESGDLLPVDAN